MLTTLPYRDGTPLSDVTIVICPNVRCRKLSLAVGEADGLIMQCCHCQRGLTVSETATYIPPNPDMCTTTVTQDDYDIAMALHGAKCDDPFGMPTLKNILRMNGYDSPSSVAIRRLLDRPIGCYVAGDVVRTTSPATDNRWQVVTRGDNVGDMVSLRPR